jgi:hypothetical protein
MLMKVGRVYFNFRNPTSLSTTIIILNMQRASKFIHSSHTIENVFKFHCKEEVLVQIFKPPYPAETLHAFDWDKTAGIESDCYCISNSAVLTAC